MAENRADEQPVAGTGTTEPTDDATARVPKARAAQPLPAPDPAAPDQGSPRKAAKKAAKRAAKAATAAGPAGEQPAKKAAKKAARKTAGGAAKKSANAAAKTTAKAPAEAPAEDVPSAPNPAAQVTAVTPTAKSAPAVPATAKSAPAVPVPAGAVPAGGAAVPVAPGAWAAAAWDAVRQLDQPPQRLAELAVAEIGPRAAAWADWLRRTYPGAPADGIARLAARQAGRQGRAVALAGAGGLPAALFCPPAAAWVRVSVVLRVAAAYGHDPADPARAAELIELLGLGPADPEVAGSGGFGSRAVAVLRQLDRVRFAVMPRRLRRSPVAALQVLAVVADHGDSIERLAHRAVRRYRPGSHSSSQASAASNSSA